MQPNAVLPARLKRLGTLSPRRRSPPRPTYRHVERRAACSQAVGRLSQLGVVRPTGIATLPWVVIRNSTNRYCRMQPASEGVDQDFDPDQEHPESDGGSAARTPTSPPVLGGKPPPDPRAITRRRRSRPDDRQPRGSMPRLLGLARTVPQGAPDPEYRIPSGYTRLRSGYRTGRGRGVIATQR